jgi:hypothetical protein
MMHPSAWMCNQSSRLAEYNDLGIFKKYIKGDVFRLYVIRYFRWGYLDLDLFTPG